MSDVVIVTGSRDWWDMGLIHKVLRKLAPSLVVEGGANGADAIAACWARAHGVKLHSFPADWKKYGRGAGPKRNVAMLEAYPGAKVVAFTLGTPGTSHMIREAKRRGFDIVVHEGKSRDPHDRWR